ncbi:MAG: hypothetical protein EBT09_09110 [Actinobacteria bacterium]|nr:hypothetical protein [Actinomycetota bacterium]
MAGIRGTLGVTLPAPGIPGPGDLRWHPGDQRGRDHPALGNPVWQLAPRPSMGDGQGAGGATSGHREDA